MNKLERLDQVARVHKAVADLKLVSSSDSVAYATIIGYLVACATKEETDLICKLIDEKVLAK